jgi:hypothetical protein
MAQFLQLSGVTNKSIMKKVSVLLVAATALVWTACNKTESRYVDLGTGKSVELEKDPSTGLLVSTETKKPVYIYVDTEKNDTIYGSTGKVINGKVMKKEDGTFAYTGEYEFKAPDGDLKVEVEKDGDIKIKDGDSKIKIDGETGERKTKKDD